MCGRYTLSKIEEIFARFQVEPDNWELAPRYNICPEETLPVVVRGDQNRLEGMQWGLIPSWSKEPKSVAINARIEGILAKPSFRRPVCHRRCLIPATGFYEWKKEVEGKTPYYIRRKDGDLFAFAGVYDVWRSPEGSQRKTFAILTSAPNELLAAVHNRMPVILTPEQERLWLTTEPAKTESLLQSLQSLPPEQLEMYRVSREVNRAQNDSPELIRAVTGEK